MNLLVTGGAGFIGSSFAINQIEQGNNIVIYDLLNYAGDEINLKSISGKYKLVQGNIIDYDKIHQTLKKYDIDVIVNFAAESHVDNSIESPGVFIETNIIGTYKLLTASFDYYKSLTDQKKNKFRYIQISTDEVYGSLGAEGKFTEDSHIKPNSPYSASKASGDLLCRAWYETYNFPVIVTNCSNNYGPRQLPEKLIPKTIFSALNNQIIPIYGDGKNIRDWIYVDDHNYGIELVINKGKIGQTYCFGGNAEKTNIDVANKICEILDELKPRNDRKSYKSQIEFVVDRLGHDRRYAIDDGKSVEELGFIRKYNFEDGLYETVKWYFENNEWYKIIKNKLEGVL